jgi:hypothetical protein
VKDRIIIPMPPDSTLTGTFLTSRPPRVAFRPERVYTSPPASEDRQDWVIENVGCLSIMNEKLIEEAYGKGSRRAARKIRQQRRRIRRTNASFGHKRGEGVPEVWRAGIVLT